MARKRRAAPETSILERIRAVAEAKSDDFLELVRLSGLSKEIDFRESNLGGVDLSGLDLRGFDLRGSILDGADLRGTDLRNTGLSRALADSAILDAHTAFEGSTKFTQMTQTTPPRGESALRDLAASLRSASRDLGEQGRGEDALSAIREAVELLRSAAVLARPGATRPELAGALGDLSLRLSDLGQREAALAAIQEAVDLYRALAAARPDAFRPDLASSLNNLSNRLSDLGQREAALAASQEAADLCRALAAARPDAFRPDLATSLGARGYILRAAANHSDAAASFGEGLRVITPQLLALPHAFANLTSQLLDDYILSLRDSDGEPDAEMLGPVLATLQKIGAIEPIAGEADFSPAPAP